MWLFTDLKTPIFIKSLKHNDVIIKLKDHVKIQTFVETEIWFIAQL